MQDQIINKITGRLFHRAFGKFIMRHAFKSNRIPKLLLLLIFSVNALASDNSGPTPPKFNNLPAEYKTFYKAYIENDVVGAYSYSLQEALSPDAKEDNDFLNSFELQAEETKKRQQVSKAYQKNLLKFIKEAKGYIQKNLSKNANWQPPKAFLNSIQTAYYESIFFRPIANIYVLTQKWDKVTTDKWGSRPKEGTEILTELMTKQLGLSQRMTTTETFLAEMQNPFYYEIDWVGLFLGKDKNAEKMRERIVKEYKKALKDLNNYETLRKELKNLWKSYNIPPLRNAPAMENVGTPTLDFVLSKDFMDDDYSEEEFGAPLEEIKAYLPKNHPDLPKIQTLARELGPYKFAEIYESIRPFLQDENLSGSPFLLLLTLSKINDTTPRPKKGNNSNKVWQKDTRKDLITKTEDYYRYGVRRLKRNGSLESLAKIMRYVWMFAPYQYRDHKKALKHIKKTYTLEEVLDVLHTTKLHLVREQGKRANFVDIPASSTQITLDLTEENINLTFRNTPLNPSQDRTYHTCSLGFCSRYKVSFVGALKLCHLIYDKTDTCAVNTKKLEGSNESKLLQSIAELKFDQRVGFNQEPVCSCAEYHPPRRNFVTVSPVPGK